MACRRFLFHTIIIGRREEFRAALGCGLHRAQDWEVPFFAHIRARLAFAFALALALTSGGCARLLGARAVTSRSPIATTFHDIAVGDERRGFLLHRPPDAASHPLPVLIVLHGSSANANVGMEESGLNAVADRIGALAVYPNGTGGIPYFRLFWNYLDCCGESHARPDEVAMIRAIIDTLSHHFVLDRTRIGVIGFSDAGTLAYELACQAPETVTAIGVISGEVPDSSCEPTPAVSTVVFHGTSDRNIRYGRTAERVAGWAAREHCGVGAVDTVTYDRAFELSSLRRRERGGDAVYDHRRPPRVAGRAGELGVRARADESDRRERRVRRVRHGSSARAAGGPPMRKLFVTVPVAARRGGAGRSGGIAVALTLVLAAFACNRRYAPPADDEWTPGTRTHTISVHDADRSYRAARSRGSSAQSRGNPRRVSSSSSCCTAAVPTARRCVSNRGWTALPIPCTSSPRIRTGRG